MEMWFSEFHTPDVKHSIRINRHLYSKQSDYQRIDIFETPEFGRVLTLDGNVMLTERVEPAWWIGIRKTVGKTFSHWARKRNRF